MFLSTAGSQVFSCLQLVAQGLTNKEIAGQLGLGEHVVKGHVKATLAWLEARNRLEAVVIATERGLV